uniref:Uncharacterized protein n=1 Tax=Anopheles culicifacies TaxID=139723 RepID=A0A182M2T7_9DIPT
MHSMIQKHRKGSRRKLISGCSHHSVGCVRKSLNGLLDRDYFNIPATIAASATTDANSHPATSTLSTTTTTNTISSTPLRQRRRRRRRLVVNPAASIAAYDDAVEIRHRSRSRAEEAQEENGCCNDMFPTANTTTPLISAAVPERYHQSTLVSVPSHHRSRTKLLYRSIVQICLALFLILGCCDAAKQEVEELTCLAWWKDGNSRYLVGLVSHHHATSNEERFRCFVYEKLSGSEYKLAQSGDATCNGLESAEVGSRIMTLKKAPLMDRCDFPVWFKGPRFWHALMGSAHYVFDASDGSLHIKKPNGHTVARSLCEQINKQTSSEMMAVVHHTMGCKSGFMCVMFYRRDTHVAELQMGTPTARLEDACMTENFDVHRTPFVTLLANNSETQLCPLEGQYMMKGFLMPTSSISRHKRNHNNKARSHRHWDVVGYRNQESVISGSSAGTAGGIVGGYIGLEAKRRSFLPRSRRTAAEARNDTYAILHADGEAAGRLRRETAGGCNINHNTNRQLLVGCNENSIIEVKPKCKTDDEELFTCHGHWQENQTTYIIAKHSFSQHGVCISYVPMEGNHVQLFVGDTCHRANMQSGQHRSMPANITSYGKCGEVNSSLKLHPYHIWLYSFVFAVLLMSNGVLR